MKIVSFDVFDTCFTRRVAEPVEVFDRVAQVLGLGKNFRFSRGEAERVASRKHGEATLEQIYRILGDWMGWSADIRDQVLAAELAEETRQLIPIPQILKHLEACRAAGARVVFLSDMYLPSAFLIERLQEHGFYKEGDLLLVSCEVRKSKVKGGLFSEATKLLGKENWHHIGNNLTADVRGAARAGIKGTHFPEGNLTAHESRLLAWSKEGEPLGAAWASAARQARIALGPLKKQEHEVASVAAGVAAPLLVAYVAWLCDRAAHHGLTRLYFLARDGQILMDLFMQIAAAKGLSIEARYLHVSRIALRFPRQFPMSDEESAGVFQANDTLPVTVIALRLGISEIELRQLLPLDCQQIANIPKRKVPACQRALAAARACTVLNPIAAERVRLLESYLRQEGLMGSGTYGIVDLGWAGSLQLGLHKALTSTLDSPEIRGFYLGLCHLPSTELKAEAFAYDYRDDEPQSLEWLTMLAELFTQADHGSTLGFQSTKACGVRPLLDEQDSENPLIPNWLEIYRASIRGFTNVVLAADALPTSPKALVRLLLDNLRHFYFFPSKAEAMAWGACRFSSHGAASIRKPLAPLPCSLRDVVWALGIRRFGGGRAEWPYGVAAKFPIPFDQAFRIFHRIIRKFRPNCL